MSSATGDRLHPTAIRTSLPALKQVARRLTEVMQTKGSLAHMEEMREIVGKVDGRYRKKGKFEELLNYYLRTGSVLVDPGKNGRLYFDAERTAIIDDARSRQVHAPLAEATATRIAALKRHHEEYRRNLEAVLTPTPPPPPPPPATPVRPADPPFVPKAVLVSDPALPLPAAPAPKTRTRRVRSRAKLEPAAGATKVLYLTAEEEDRWREKPWFEEPSRYFIIPIESRETCQVPTRLGELIAHIETNGFEVRDGELVRDAFARVSTEVDPDRALNPSTSYLKVAGYRPDYPTNGWGVIFLWQKGARILTGVEGFGRFTYVSMDGPIKRQQRTKAAPVTERAESPAPKAPTPPPPAPAIDPYGADALAQLGQTELLALLARTRQEVAARLDRRAAELEARGKRLAQDLASHALESDKLKQERFAQLGEMPESKTLSN